MEATNWIALYAAIVATIALIWQAWVRWSEGRPRLSVDLVLFLFVWSNDDATTLDSIRTDAATQANGLHWRASISVTNTGHRPVQVSDIRLRNGTERTGIRSWKAERWELPWKIESGEQRRCFVTDDDAPQLDLRSPLHAHVTIASGQVYESPQLQVRSATKSNPDANSQEDKVVVVLHPDLADQLHERALGPEWRSRAFMHYFIEND
jgi:hypothetical protein